MTANQHEHLDDDAKTLAEMGYAQELRRGMSAFSNFAVSFSIISILAGCITSYKIALVSGGPSALTLGWLIVGAMVLAVALAMAEVCSRYPTAGGLYFWAGRLAKTNKRQWAWFVGWFNFLGEVAVTAANRLRLCHDLDGVRQPDGLGGRGHAGQALRHLRGHHRGPRPAEHLRGQTGGPAVQHLRLVARRRRADHRRACCGSCPRSTSRCPGR